MRVIFIVIFMLNFMASGCAVSPKHPSLQEAKLPELVPVRDFVANIDYNGGYSISPDGQKLAWNGVEDLSSAILWRDRESSVSDAIKFDKGAPAAIWAADSRHILYHHDPSGRENTHVFVVDTKDPHKVRRDLTPYPGSKAYLLSVPSRQSDTVFIMHNRRDPAIFDLYSVNLETGKELLVHENNDNIIRILIDDDGLPRARVKQTDSSRLLQVPLAGNKWKTLIEAGKFDVIIPKELSIDGSKLYFFSNIGRDKSALFLLDLDSGDQQLIYEHDEVDVYDLRVSRLDRRPLYLLATPDYPEIHFFDETLKQQMTPFIGDNRSGVHLSSIDRDERFATLISWDHSGAKFYLVDLHQGTSELLAESASRELADVWVEQKPVTIKASDGMQLHAYLARPAIKNSGPLPTVLLVHGGPWARDGWGYHGMTQFLANRGYAVLRVNYRGSRGYGRRYEDAAIGEFAGKMHQDLIDAIDWAIAQGISDVDNIAIVGGSYGGYATLVGLTMTPDQFACGVDIVGIADLATLLESAPPYWKNLMPYMHRFIGDPQDPAQREIMDARSPLNFADQVKAPLLVYHGVNDPRVNINQSDRMVAALEAEGKEVEYVVIDDEGHGFHHWKNQLDLYRKTEDFLGECIGGRSSGFDFYQLGSWAF